MVKRFGSWPAYNGYRVVLDNDLRLKTAIQVTVDFGYPGGGEDSTASVYIPAPTIAANLPIVCSPAAQATADHDVEDAFVEGLVAYAGNIVAGTGFTVYCNAPRGTWGRYLINVMG